jgi:hypothetical protein
MPVEKRNAKIINFEPTTEKTLHSRTVQNISNTIDDQDLITTLEALSVLYGYDVDETRFQVVETTDLIKE